MGIESYKIREAAAVPTEPAPPEPPLICAKIIDGEIVVSLADFNRMLGNLETERAALRGQKDLLTTLALDNARIAKMWRAMFFVASGALAAKVALEVAR